MNFAQMVRQNRTDLNIGVRELARRADCSPTMVAHMESGVSMPGYELTVRLAEELDLPVDRLLIEAGFVPRDARPRTAFEAELMRRVRKLSRADQERLLKSGALGKGEA
jgi:transcriptional regulator with XRE-family HTH domain